ncbi:MAG: flagellar FlbD family protein [Candidatus Riflebacteria bacterium]|nr:flagellar FlbD family protein [Candidatus Riflebacteria bacterium]
MIKVTRYNGSQVFINAELIQSVEAIPDSLITLINGKTLMVKENLKSVIRKIIRYRKKIAHVPAYPPSKSHIDKVEEECIPEKK